MCSVFAGQPQPNLSVDEQENAGGRLDEPASKRRPKRKARATRRDARRTWAEGGGRCRWRREESREERKRSTRIAEDRARLMASAAALSSPLHRPTRLHSTCYSTEQFTTAYTLRAQRKPSNQTEPKQHATGADAMRLSCICSVESECSPKLFIRRANDARRQRDEMSNRQSIKSSRQQNAQHYCKVKVFTSRFCTSREDKRKEEHKHECARGGGEKKRKR